MAVERKSLGFLSGSLILALLLALVPPANAEYPAALEERVQSVLLASAATLAPGIVLHTWLLSPEEALVELTMPASPSGDPRSDAVELIRARNRISEQVSLSFPGVNLSELSTFRIAPRRERGLMAMNPSQQ